MHKFYSPYLIQLLILKNKLYYLELILDKNDSDTWPDGYYEEILETTDRYYRTKNKLLNLFDDKYIDGLLNLITKNGGDC